LDTVAHESSDSVKVSDYHAHVYYDTTSRPEAARLREALVTGFEVEMGRWRDTPVGPHPQPMYQVKFGVDQFARIVPWLMLNHGALTILIHPNTGDAYRDHAFSGLWMGEKLKLRLEVLRPAS
jgi:DOPA 4,5-dioxygenase